MTSGSRSGFCVLANRMVTLTSGMSGRQTTSSQRSGHREDISQFIPLDFRMTRLSALMICSVLMSSMIKRLVQKHTNVFQNVENFERLENADHETFRSRATSCLVWIRRASKSMSLSHLCTRWTITTIAFVIYLFCSFSEFVTINTMMVKILLDWWTR